jgi:hypothetical protein
MRCCPASPFRRRPRIRIGGTAAETPWKAGFAAQKITPTEPLMLAGYASRTVPAKDVVDDLYLKVLALEDSAGTRAILITADLIGFRADFTEPARSRISEATGVARERILFNASHTHAGPAVMLGLSSHYTISEPRRTSSSRTRNGCRTRA